MNFPGKCAQENAGNHTIILGSPAGSHQDRSSPYVIPPEFDLIVALLATTRCKIILPPEAHQKGLIPGAPKSSKVKNIFVAGLELTFVGPEMILWSDPGSISWPGRYLVIDPGATSPPPPHPLHFFFAIYSRAPLSRHANKETHLLYQVADCPCAT